MLLFAIGLMAGVALGMIIVGVPYSESRLVVMTEITGGTPYGASTITAGDGSRLPTENELAIARFQGRHVAEITARPSSPTPPRPCAARS